MNRQNPKPAATVVLCRITTDWPFKILLIKRSASAAFLPGAHVFPGGRVEHSDADFGTFLQNDQENLKRIKRYFNCDLSLVSAHLAAAIRETLEEVGISIFHIKENDSAHHCSANRLAALLKDPACDDARRIYPHLDNIWPISWWVTPEGEARRYNTWFFLSTIDDAMCSKEASTTPDLESSERRWLTAKEALDLYDNQDIFLAPPTRTILERMAESRSLKEFLSFVDLPLTPIHPFFVDGGDGKQMLILPGDPMHHHKIKPRLPIRTRYAFP